MLSGAGPQYLIDDDDSVTADILSLANLSAATNKPWLICLR